MTESVLDTTDTTSSMNITSAQYVNCSDRGTAVNIKVVIDEETLLVPITVGNRHYDEIMRQVESGDLTIADAD